MIAALSVPPDPFASALVLAVEADRERIDALLAAASVDWGLDRMPVLDLSVLRIAVAELIGWPETPLAVVLNEAVELAKEFDRGVGTVRERSLSTVAGEVRPAPSEPAEPAQRSRGAMLVAWAPKLHIRHMT